MTLPYFKVNLHFQNPGSRVLNRNYLSLRSFKTRVASNYVSLFTGFCTIYNLLAMVAHISIGDDSECTYGTLFEDLRNN